MSLFICSKCDAQFPKWQGRCPECQSWGTIKESVGLKQKNQPGQGAKPLPADELIDLAQVGAVSVQRFPTGLTEVDRVLGGGLVAGSLVLLGGQPGIGKSTLVLQIANSLLQDGRTVFYFSGEESPGQLKLRAERLKLPLANLLASTATNIDAIAATIVQQQPQLVIIDSIQTVWTDDAEGTAGGVSQVRAATAKLLAAAKREQLTIIIIGHVTKEGVVAGPKTLEHLVDTVLYLEGERLESVRLLRVVKNRFGPSGEVGVLQLAAAGLVPVSSSGRVFLSAAGKDAGSSIGALVDGNRVFLTNVDALVEKTQSPYPRRTVIGYDANRLQVLLAILHRQAKLNFSTADVYIHLPGGLKSSDPSLDLAVCLSLASAKKEQALPANTLFCGEVSLNGRLRPVRSQAKIIQEAASLGFQRIVLPAGEKKLTSQKIAIKEFSYLSEVVQKLLLTKS